MIKHLSILSPYRYQPTLVWPDNPKETATLFSGRPPLRKMRVLVDSELLEGSYESADVLTKATVLESLLNQSPIEFFKYAYGKPPATVMPTEDKRLPSPPHQVYEGWAVAYPRESDRVWPVTYMSNKGKYGVGGVRDNAPDLARTDDSQPIYLELDSEQRAQQREADVLAFKVASRVLRADLYITERSYLYSHSPLVREQGLTVCTPGEALTLVALYLRRQGHFIGHDRHVSFNRGLYFWIGMRELLPEAWRWFSACAQESSAIQILSASNNKYDRENNRLLLLGGTTLNRISRALQTRDEIHIALNQPVNNDTSDDALASLDTVLSLLMGALDASARVAHHVLGFTIAEKNAGWQSYGWISQVAKSTPNLRSLVSKGASGEHLLTVLRLLRNSVHGVAPEGITYENGGNRETLIALPLDDETDVLAAMDNMGGRENWGFRPILLGESYIEPAVLVDRLFEEVVKLLNDLMRETPVELLPHITAPVGNSPPIDDSTFSEWNSLSIRWQLGF